MDGSLFEPVGERWLPTDLARGPWSPDSLHGGPVAALVTRAAERAGDADGMHVVRLTVELLRPVPVAPLTVSAEVVRPGRKVQDVDIRVADGDRDVAWARAVRIRTRPDAGGPLAEPSRGPVPGRDPEAPPPPERGVATPSLEEGYRAFHNAGAELRFADGRFDGLGPSRVWIRLAVPVVPGEAPSPLQRAAAAADFGNGVSAVLPFTDYTFINPDLTVYLERPPVGEWIGLEASTRLGVAGVALSQSALWDVEGPFGRALQSLVVQPR